MADPGFVLSFINEHSEHPPYPHGYWYATTPDGSYDGDGPTPEIALAKLIDGLVEALNRVDDVLAAQQALAENGPSIPAEPVWQELGVCDTD